MDTPLLQADPLLPSMREGFRAVIIGATGGIGGAIHAALAANPHCGDVIGLARTPGVICAISILMMTPVSQTPPARSVKAARLISSSTPPACCMMKAAASAPKSHGNISTPKPCGKLSCQLHRPGACWQTFSAAAAASGQSRDGPAFRPCWQHQ